MTWSPRGLLFFKLAVIVGSRLLRSEIKAPSSGPYRPLATQSLNLFKTSMGFIDDLKSALDCLPVTLTKKLALSNLVCFSRYDWFYLIFIQKQIRIDLYFIQIWANLDLGSLTVTWFIFSPITNSGVISFPKIKPKRISRSILSQSQLQVNGQRACIYQESDCLGMTKIKMGYWSDEHYSKKATPWGHL